MYISIIIDFRLKVFIICQDIICISAILCYFKTTFKVYCSLTITEVCFTTLLFLKLKFIAIVFVLTKKLSSLQRYFAILFQIVSKSGSWEGEMGKGSINFYTIILLFTICNMFVENVFLCTNTLIIT